LLVRKANSNIAEDFSHLLEYINWANNLLFKMLEKNQWIEEHYYESYTLKKSNDITTGLFFMWRIGWLILRITEISDDNKVPINLQIQNAFNNLFDALGKWIYHQEGLLSITKSFQEYETLFGQRFNQIYDEVLEEAERTRNNIAKFLQKL
jgi:hypothetical protein